MQDRRQILLDPFCSFVDLAQLFRESNAFVVLYGKLSRAMIAGHEPRIGGDTQRGAAIVAGNGCELHVPGSSLKREIVIHPRHAPNLPAMRGRVKKR